VLEWFGRVVTSACRAMRRLGFADTSRLRLCPEFKILWAVIIAASIDVMDRFRTLQVSAKFFFHHQTVFRNIIAPLHCIGMFRKVNPNIPLCTGHFPSSTSTGSKSRFAFVPVRIRFAVATAYIIQFVMCITRRNRCTTATSTNCVVGYPA